jgi:hypothetical protein
LKASKTAANYRKGDLEHHCAICTMFRPPHDCLSVEGVIQPADLCDYFKRSNGNAMDRKGIRRAA